MDFVVVEPFGFDHEQRDRDDKVCRETEDELVRILSDVLNEFHGVDRSCRYWRIICGQWLRAYVDLVFNRYSTLKCCLERHAIGSTVCFDDSAISLATADTRAFYSASNDDVWNNILYSKLLLYVDSGPIDKTTLEINSDLLSKPVSQENRSLIKDALVAVKHNLYALVNLFSRESDAVIFHSYLPYFEELKLKLALRQAPVRYEYPTFCSSETDVMLRKKLQSQLLMDNETGYSRCVRNLLFEMMPTCYLEDYKMMSVAVEKINWPRNPRFIFTSKNYFYDEFFKFMTAKQVERGTPYYVGQHGNFATDKTNYPSVEMYISDKYLRWGSATTIPQEVPAFVLKLANKKLIAPDRNGELLFIQNLIGHRTEIWDNTYRYICSMNDNFTFYNQLDEKIKKLTVLRLHSAQDFFKQDETKRWREVDKNIRISGPGSLDKALRRSRLVVFSYNSAGFIECLSQNYPTLALTDDLSFIGDMARPDYKLLVDLGIIHLSPLTAAQKINSIWNDIDSWWIRPEIQNARTQFCEKFARQSEHPLSELRKILNEFD